MKDILIRNRYRVERKVADGGFGVVYSGTDLESNDEVAIKLEDLRHDYPVLEHEASVYESLAGGVGIPRMRWYGQECDFHVLISDLLGPSLEDLFNFCGRKFTLKTVLMLADQLISRLEYVHSRSFVHRDVKPENFVMGAGKLGNVVYVIDFGLAREYRDLETHSQRAPSVKRKLGEQSRRDDLESLGYVMIYFLRGCLPWDGMKAATDEERNELIKERKMNLAIKDLCGGLPDAFASYFTYVQTLEGNTQPKYSSLRKLFRDLFTREGYQHDHVFDWTIKLFSEMHGSTSQPDQ